MSKIVFIDQYNSSGGGQTILINLIGFALESGFEVEVWIPKGEYFQNVFKKESRLTFREIKSPLLNSGRKGLMNSFYWVLYSINFLTNLSKLKGVDFVYVNGPRLSLGAIFLSIFYPAKYYYHLHLLHTKIEHTIFKIAGMMPRTEYLIFGSDLILERFHKDASQKKKHIVFDGFLGTRISSLPFVSRLNEFNSDRERQINFMLLARVYEGKGHDIFLKLAADFPQHKFYIIGKPADQDYYNRLTSQATTNVYFTFGEDVPSLIQNLSIHVSIVPSLVEESFGLSSIESMAMSCLTIVSNRGNLPLQAQKTGSWVFHDYEQLKKMVEQIEDMDHTKLNMISREQYEAVKKHYSYDTAKELFRALII